MNLLKKILITALALVITAHVVPGIHVSGLIPLLMASLVLGLLNALVRPILVILTLPITIITLGLFLFVINGFLLFISAQFVTGFSVANLWTAILGSLLVSLVSAIANRFM